MAEPHSSRPENGEGIFTIRGLYAFFVQWITSSERLMEARLEAIEALGKERDRRYEERHIADMAAIDKALVAAEKAVQAALEAQKESAAKTENAQTQYNQGHNDLIRKMDEQHKETLPRPEANQRFTMLDNKMEDLKKEIASLREYRSTQDGKGYAVHEDRQQSNVTTGQVIAIVIGVAGISAGIVLAILQ